MQFVQSVPVAEVLATEGNIQVRRITFFPSSLFFLQLLSTLPLHHWSTLLISNCSYRASFGSMRPVKKDPTVSARR